MRSRKPVSFLLEELHQFANCKKFDRLFNEWVDSNYKKEFKPSIDRINNKKNYDLDNIQWLSWKENRFKQSMERRGSGKKVAQIKDGYIINIFKSQRDAVKQTGLRQGNLSTVLVGNRNKCGGFQWKYLD